MKSRLFIIAIVLFAGAGLWWVLSQKSLAPATANDSSTPASADLGVKPLTASSRTSEANEIADNTTPRVLPGPIEQKPKPVALAAAESAPAGPELGETGSGLTPLTVLENMRSAFREYQLRFGANPVGDNSEITASLSGQNPRQVNFVKPDDGLRVNDRGQFVDNWGTPFFFHQLSRTEMEIHSAGPDRKMWSQDDLVLK